MNATQPVFQAQPNNDAVQPNASASEGSQANRAKSQDFARALNDAGAAKPARKSPASKPRADSGGGQLPPHGNRLPHEHGRPPMASTDAVPTAHTAARKVAVASQGSAAGSAAAPGTGFGAAGTGSGLAIAGAGIAGTGVGIAGAGAAAGTVPDPLKMTPYTLPVVQGLDPPQTAAMVPGMAAADLVPNSAGSQSAADLGPVATPPKEAGLPPAAATPIAQSGAGRATPAARVPAASPGGARVAKTDATADKAAIAAATSAPTSANDTGASSSNTSGETPSADPTTQAIMAAATASATSAPTTDSSSPNGDVAAADTGVAAPGGLAANASPAAAVASTAMHAVASTAAAVTAATAASVAQAVSASAAADKHSNGNGPDLSLSGSSIDGTAGAAQLMSSNAAISTTDTPMPTFKVPAGVDTTEFGQGVADRVSLMIDGNMGSAKLQVNPPALGPIEVRIALQSGHAQIWFTSHSAVTRDALESTAPQLREMLGAQGFGQVSVDISQRSFQERSPQPQGYEKTRAIGSESSASMQAPSVRSRSASGLLDAYA
jgi:flagellar hook-length control protein FliK